MAWVMLIGAGVFEMAFAVLLKLSHGLTRLWPTVGFAVAAMVSFGLLTLALRQQKSGPPTRCGLASARSVRPPSACSGSASRYPC